MYLISLDCVTDGVDLSTNAGHNTKEQSHGWVVWYIACVVIIYYNIILLHIPVSEYSWTPRTFGPPVHCSKGMWTPGPLTLPFHWTPSGWMDPLHACVHTGVRGRAAWTCMEVMLETGEKGRIMRSTPSSTNRYMHVQRWYIGPASMIATRVFTISGCEGADPPDYALLSC